MYKKYCNISSEKKAPEILYTNDTKYLRLTKKFGMVYLKIRRVYIQNIHAKMNIFEEHF